MQTAKNNQPSFYLYIMCYGPSDCFDNIQLNQALLKCIIFPVNSYFQIFQAL